MEKSYGQNLTDSSLPHNNCANGKVEASELSGILHQIDNSLIFNTEHQNSINNISAIHPHPQHSMPTTHSYQNPNNEKDEKQYQMLYQSISKDKGEISPFGTVIHHNYE